VVSFTHLPLYPRKRAPSMYRIGGCVDPRDGLDDLEKKKFFTVPGPELQSLSRPACHQSLYRLRYPGSSQGRLYTEIFGSRNTNKRLLCVALINVRWICIIERPKRVKGWRHCGQFRIRRSLWCFIGRSRGNYLMNMTSEALTAMNINTEVFWDVKPRHSVDVSQRLG
jgi:hypothetical protein